MSIISEVEELKHISNLTSLLILFLLVLPRDPHNQKSGAGIAAATGISMPPKYQSITFDCCVTGDMICQTTGSMMPHLGYGGSASEKAAVSFAVEKLQGGKGAPAAAAGALAGDGT